MNRSRQRRDDEKEQRREAIIDAAVAVFHAQGFEAAKMEDVARAARISRALVYLYFKNKAELQFAICLRALRTLHARMQAAVTQQSHGAAQVLAIGRAYIAYAREEPAYFAALSRFEAHQAGCGAEGSVEHAVLQAGIAVHQLTVATLHTGMRDGSIRDDIEQPMLVAMTLWAFTHGLIQIAQTKGEFLADAGVAVDAILEQGLELALRGLQPAALPGRKKAR
ncbi:transcriptional regulator, TetR family [Solimonas aquatica]|uniref:Transcriptional regulator, TetR family n=1 Tax=Solimonas aquatica TaxID=489703 RepID=A0A1H9CN68_9GAMM|nr:TetR/AcrR family transcriptional regulator [Solimonas aquatica]SEQ02646.1 transcriptional regulator, TetR family [Solimonas aquatica]